MGEVSIRFVRNYRVKPDGPDYKAGQQLSVPEASANHFVNRGAAVRVPEAEAPQALPLGGESAPAEAPAPKKRRGRRSAAGFLGIGG